MNLQESSQVKSYYDFISHITTTLGGLIAEKLHNSPETYQHLTGPVEHTNGRAQSLHFETLVADSIGMHKTEFIEKVNHNNTFSGWSLKSIESHGEEDEKSKRSPWDIAFVVTHPDGKDKTEWVNIKYSSGKSADNVGGWECLYYALTGKQEKIAGRSIFFDKMTTYIPELRDSHQYGCDYCFDYFLWVFDKDINFDQACASSRCYGLMSHSDNLRFNHAQSFPVQAKYPKHTDIDPDFFFHPAAYRVDFIRKFITSIRDYHYKKVSEMDNILNSF